MTKSQIVSSLSEKTGVTKDKVEQIFDEMTKLAYSEAKNGFVFPGIGKLILAQREARTGKNPITGETIQLPAKKAVKFRILKECKQEILNLNQ